MTMSPETVTTRFTKGIPSQTASPTAAQVGGVEHGAAHGGRQPPRGHLAAGEGLDQLFFSPLGVPVL